MTKKFFYVLLSIVLLNACNNDIEKIKLHTENTNMPVETGKNVVINYTDSGLLKARIFAPALERFANEQRNETIMPQGMSVYFLDKNQKVESSLKAKYAIRYDRERRMVAKNNVVLVNEKGDTLKTELLNWDEATQKLYTDEYVRIATQTEIIEATGFESNTEFTRYKFKKISGVWTL